MRRKVLTGLITGGVLFGLLLAGCSTTETAAPAKSASSSTSIATSAAVTPTVAKPAATPTDAIKTGGQLTVIEDTDGTKGGMFDVHYGGMTGYVQIGVPVYESLLTHDLDTFETVPRLAERWELAPDAMSITLYLRKGVKWQNVPPVNGREFTADDVKWNIDRVKNANPPVDMSGFLKPVTNVQVIDKYTVRINFSEPFASILWWLADSGFGMYPHELREQYGDKQAKVAIGTGPFILKSYEPNVGVTYVKNPDYWQPGLPRLDTLKILFVLDASARLAAMRTGQGDVLNRAKASDRESLMKSNPELRILDYSGSIWGIRLNCLAKPFSDVRVRQALNIALDRQQFVQLVSAGFGDVAGYYGPTTGPYMTPLEELAKRPGYRQPKDADIAEAKKLLAEAGYADGLTVEALTISSASNYVPANELIREQLKAIGITWNIKVVDYATISTRALSAPADYQAAYMSMSSRGDPDMTNAYGTTSGANISGWGSKELDALLLKGQSVGDEAKRVPIYRQVEEKMSELLNNIPLHTINTWEIVGPAIKDFKSNKKITGGFLGETYKYVWRTDIK